MKDGYFVKRGEEIVCPNAIYMSYPVNHREGSALTYVDNFLTRSYQEYLREPNIW